LVQSPASAESCVSLFGEALVPIDANLKLVGGLPRGLSEIGIP
jgi:hypothetical protein